MIVIAYVPMGHHDVFLVLVPRMREHTAIAASATARFHRVVHTNRDRIVGHRVHFHRRVFPDHRRFRGIVHLHVLHRRGGHVRWIRYRRHVAVRHRVQIRLVVSLRRQHSFQTLVQQRVILLREKRSRNNFRKGRFIDQKCTKLCYL